MKIDLPRELAMQILYKIENEKAYSNIVLNKEIEKNREKLSGRDIGFISEIVYGTVTWKLTIDSVIEMHSKIKLKKISPYVLAILRTAAYQILFLDKVPKSAAVNESVNLSKKYAYRSTGFINAILRKIEKDDLEKLENLPIKERICKRYSMPMWLLEELEEEYDLEQIEEIAIQNNKVPELTIRINSLKTTKEELKAKLAKEGIEAVDAKLKDFLVVKGIKDISHLPLFQNGYFTFQDQAAGLAAILVQAKPGEKVLDACSAPGGKTTYLAERMGDKGSINAWDLHAHRAKLIQEASDRLGIHIIHTEEKDSRVLDKKLIQTYDKILLDVPCMGIGVIRRKPDIKWTHTKDEIKEITELQFNILHTCANYLKQGGRLVYSTCSILKEENEKNVEKFLKTKLGNEFFVENLDKIEEKELKKYEKQIEKNKYIKLLPSLENDGFFITILTRK